MTGLVVYGIINVVNGQRYCIFVFALPASKIEFIQFPYGQDANDQD